METSQTKWICAQLGAREHYAIPRALHAKGLLAGLFTDAWSRPGNPLGLIKRSLRERYHAELSDASVASANASLLAFEAQARVKGLTGWNRIMARNQWFQRQALQMLKTENRKRKHSTFNTQHSTLNSQPVLFCYSYAALELFRFAKAHGWKTVLGQIDGGPVEEQIVAQLNAGDSSQDKHWKPAPSGYWVAWRQECDLADTIIVNSVWSREMLVKAEIDPKKIHVVPLAYEPLPDAEMFKRTYPDVFTIERPLRVLFLGQINLRKGVRPLLGAIEMLRGEPIQFIFAGPMQMEMAPEILANKSVLWLGPVPRGAVAEHYRTADVFVFPTFSDGFGLTQLEAQAWHLPIVASRFCGDVVRDGVNGLQLAEVSAATITHALRQLLAAPGKLQAMSRASSVGAQFSLDGIANKLESVLD